jgi:hypothetical protein
MLFAAEGTPNNASSKTTAAFKGIEEEGCINP